MTSSRFDETDILALLRLLRETAVDSGAPRARLERVRAALTKWQAALGPDPRLIAIIRREFGLLPCPERPGGFGSRASVRVPLPALAPRYQRVLGRLLGGESEKQIARALGLSPHTVHEYVKRIYRTYGVESRGELLSQWIGRPEQAAMRLGPSATGARPVPVQGSGDAIGA